MKPRRLIAFLALLGLAACEPAPETRFQGYGEAELLFIAAEEAGRLIALNAQEGQTVAAGAALAVLDSEQQVAAAQAAQAQVGEAEARLAKALAAAERPEEIAVLRAAERRAAAALDLARATLDRQKALAATGAASKARLDEAEQGHRAAAAALEEARRRIAVAQLAARGEEIDIARQALAQAKAQQAWALVRLERRQLAAPAEALVQEVYFRTGEFVNAGRPILALLPPGAVKLRFFVPETRIAQFKPGQRVLAQCDGCAQAIAAEITFIAPNAEYTPPVIYSREERAKLVFMVEARPETPGSLRPGQPVTVTLRP